MSNSNLCVDSNNVKTYPIHKPVYSNKIFESIRETVLKWIDLSEYSIAVDVACGNCEATEFLNSLFDTVIAMDISMSQLNIAKNSKACKEGTELIANSASAIPLQDNSCIYIQAFQAAHWLDLKKFYLEVDRILKPGGVLVLGIYVATPVVDLSLNKSLLESVGKRAFEKISTGFTKQCNFLVDNYYLSSEVLGAIDSLYRYVKLPYTDSIRDFHVEITEEWTIAQFISYLKNWSCWQAYLSKTGETSLLDELEKEWTVEFGDKPIIFSLPVAIHYSRKALESPDN